jgi:probable rRNA maturation factor
MKKPTFKINAIFEKKDLKNFKISNKDLNQRIKFVLSLICDFSCELSIKFCLEEEMIQANTQFRNKQKSTDVLSFPNDPSFKMEGDSYLGDILICLPVCQNQAKKARKTLSQELEKMIIHGIVHLKGFDHERNPSAWKVMNTLESVLQKELVKNFELPTWCSYVIE